MAGNIDEGVTTGREIPFCLSDLQGRYCDPATPFAIEKRKWWIASKKDLLKQMNQMAVNYPNYLAIHPVLADDLSEMERRIVHLYSQGIKMDEVCSLCGFSYNTLKYHNRNIYRKLGVTSRIEAVQRAKELKL